MNNPYTNQLINTPKKHHTNLNAKLSIFTKKFNFVIKYSFLLFFLIHGAFFAHRYANEDYHHELYNIGKVVTSGRFIGLFSNIMYPWLQGLFAALFMSIVAFMVLEILEINNKYNKILTIALLMSFPALSHGFAYLYMTQIYTIAILSATSAVYFTNKYQYGFIIGAIFICISLGAYQSYIGFAIVLSIILITKNWYKNANFKFNKMLHLLLMGILGIGLYFIIIKILYPYMGIEMDSYKGLNEMGHIRISELPMLIKRTYVGYRDFLLGRQFFYSGNIKIFIHLLMIGGILSTIIHRAIQYKFKGYTAIILLLIASVPIGMNITDLIVPKWHTITLNTYQFVLLYIWFIQLIELTYTVDNAAFKTVDNIKTININTLKSTLTIILCTTIIFSQIMISSQFYLKVENYYEGTAHFYNRLYARIEATDGYHADVPIAIFATNDSQYLQDNTIHQNMLTSTGLWCKYIGLTRYDTENFNDKSFDVMRNILNVPAKMATKEQYEDIEKSDTFINMPTYPSPDGIQFINDVLVVKF